MQRRGGRKEAGQRGGAEQSHPITLRLFAGSPGRGQARRRAAEGSRQPRVMNLWMSLLAKLRGCCVLHRMGPFKGL